MRMLVSPAITAWGEFGEVNMELMGALLTSNQRPKNRIRLCHRWTSQIAIFGTTQFYRPANYGQSRKQ